MEIFFREESHERHFPPYGHSLARQEDQARILEGMAQAQPLLLGELALAEAPFSRRNRSCVLYTGANLYGGHSLEFATGDYVTAEAMALEKAGNDDALIKTLYVTGRDVLKAKHAMPTAEAYELLSPRLHPQAEIVLLQPNTQDSCLAISPQSHRKAYERKPFSILNGMTMDLEDEIQAHTILDREDATLFAHLNRRSTETGTHYYLTGSSSGRGWASNLVKNSYNDLDIIAVTNAPKARAEAQFEDLADVWYDDLSKEPHNVTLWPSGEVREAVTYTGTCFVRQIPMSIDFFVASRLEDAIVRPETLERNYFHQIS